MIRLIEEKDIETVCKIVNDNWKSVYSGYVNNEMLSEKGCNERYRRLKNDFESGRLFNYVYEKEGKVIALLSFGDTADTDKKDAFEIWRIYIEKSYQNKGIGTELLRFAEEKAYKSAYKEIIIWAFKENVNALAFYNRHGYTKNKEEFLGQPYLADAVRLIKKI